MEHLKMLAPFALRVFLPVAPRNRRYGARVTYAHKVAALAVLGFGAVMVALRAFWDPYGLALLFWLAGGRVE